MGVGAVAGTKIFIGTSEASPSPDDWVEIKNVSNLGSLMTQFNKITVESVGDGYTRQIKGTQLVPPFDLQVNRDDADAGQTAAVTAAADRNSKYWFKIEENDAGPGSGFTLPTRFQFQARIYSSGPQYGGVNDLKKSQFQMEVEPDSITKIAAS